MLLPFEDLTDVVLLSVRLTPRSINSFRQSFTKKDPDFLVLMKRQVRDKYDLAGKSTTGKYIVGCFYRYIGIVAHRRYLKDLL